MQTRLPKQQIVLWGVGHTNAHILKMWRMHPIPDAELICISNFPVATYSGMLPAVLAGQSPVYSMEIDLFRLTQSVGARLVLEQVAGLDRAGKQLLFADRPPLDYDLLSIGIGSQPLFPEGEQGDSESLVAVKPMQTFLSRLRVRLEAVATNRTNCRVLIVGGGAGSLEIAWCLRSAWNRKSQPDSSPLATILARFQQLQISLLTSGSQIGSGLKPATIRRATAVCHDLEIEIFRNERIEQIDSTGCRAASGREFPADLIIWATSARGPKILSELNLPIDSRGFLSTRDSLQSIADEAIFAVGDSGTQVGTPSDKAGVFAVRQGPVLWENLQRSVRGEPLQPFRPQRDFLKLLNLGDGRAIVEYRGWSFCGASWWRMKNRIDSRFMQMYQNYHAPEMHSPEVPDPAGKPRCLGCGGKVGAKMLKEALQELPRYDSGRVLLGLNEPDDAAIVSVPSGQATLTTDYFLSPVADPYLAGRIAALNAVSDLFVMGARPSVALVNLQIPQGHPRGQKRLMREVMLGAAEELRGSQVEIAGGHTIEGPQLGIGFTILGEQQRSPLRKSGLQPGARLILSKPLGTGALLAAGMQSALRGNDYVSLKRHLLQSNQIALELAARFPIQAMTDVTGFGLAGHLYELIEASHCGAEIELARLPLLEGFDLAVSEGFLSTLAPDNEQFVSGLKVEGRAPTVLERAALFDPQTCGGILLGVAPDSAPGIIASLRQSGFPAAAEIGTVLSASDSLPFFRWT